MNDAWEKCMTSVPKFLRHEDGTYSTNIDLMPEEIDALVTYYRGILGEDGLNFDVIKQASSRLSVLAGICVTCLKKEQAIPIRPDDAK